MKKSLGWVICRLLLQFAFVFLLGMLYWSSLLQEEGLKGNQRELQEIKKQLDDLKTSLRQLKSSSTFVDVTSTVQGERGRVHLDEEKSNLLKRDRFYDTTLPSLLPDHFKPSGTRHLDVIGKPDNLHPFILLEPLTSFINQCQLQLTTLEVGKYETMAPYLAVRMEEKEIKDQDGKILGVEYWVYLRDQVYWQPLNPGHFSEEATLAPIFLQKHQVTAHDVKFYVDALLNPFVQEAGAVALRNYYSEIEEIRVVDDLTLVVRWKTQEVKGSEGTTLSKAKYSAKWLTGGLKPLPRFVYQYFSDGKKIVEEEDLETYKTNSVWAEQFSRHWAKQVIVSCGPWIFDGATAQVIRFKRNPDHFNPLEVLVEKMEVFFKETPEAVWQDFKIGATDTYPMNVSKLLEFKNFLNSKEYARQKQEGLGIKQLDYTDRSYFYIGWNQATPFFQSKNVRKAMTLAIDRNLLIEQNLNGLGVPITGPFALDSSAYDTTIVPWPYDPQEAKRLLEMEGWYDLDGDGIRDKWIDGKLVKFSFALTYYVKNPITKVNCEYIADSLKKVGVECRLNGQDITDLTHEFENKEFQAIFFGWALGMPPEEPKQLWHSSGAKEKGSSNAVGFANAEADQIIERLLYEYDPKEREQLYHRFDKIIHEEQPYTLLYTPKITLLYREYVKDLFIPSERRDLIPDANVSQPDFNLIWLAPH